MKGFIKITFMILETGLLLLNFEKNMMMVWKFDIIFDRSKFAIFIEVLINFLITQSRFSITIFTKSFASSLNNFHQDVSNYFFFSLLSDQICIKIRCLSNFFFVIVF